MKRIFSLLLALILIFSLFSVSFSGEEDYTSNTAGNSSVLYNIQTKLFLVEKETETEICCAALPRLMLCILFVESGKSPDTVITVPDGTKKLTPQLSAANIYDGNTVSYGDLMNAILVANSQEAAVALALDMFGSEDKALSEMNKRAIELGAKNTNFTNASGYLGGGNKTTLKDIALIVAHAVTLDYILDRSDASLVTIKVNDQQRPLYTRNSLVDSSSSFYFNRATGLSLSGDGNYGYVEISTVLSDNSRFIAINYSKTSSDTAMTDTKTLLQYALHAYDVKKLIGKNEPLTEVEVKNGGGTDHVILYAESELSVSLPKTVKDEEITCSYEDLETPIPAPIESGQPYGWAVYYYNGNEIGRTRMISRSSVSEDLVSSYGDEISNLFGNPFLWFGIIGVVGALTIYLLISGIIKSKRKKEEKIRQKQRVYRKFK